MWQSLKNVSSGVKAASKPTLLVILGFMMAIGAQVVVSQQHLLPSPFARGATTNQPVATLTSSTNNSISQITVAGTAQNGVSFTAPASGWYQISIVEGAYCTYAGPHWRSKLRIYKNKPLQWGLLPGNSDIEPVNFDDSIGDGLGREEAAALALAKTMRTKIVLQRGDQLLFVPIDSKGWYSDNSGQLVLQIALQTPPRVS